jgi:hypothetical protein
MQEPSLSTSPSVAPDDEAREAPEDEVARLEKLLAARARESSALSLELERRSGLLREALERLSSSAAGELDDLRRGRDAAVQRAIEAELNLAELTFQLDETRAALQMSQPASSVGEMRGLYSRIAELEEADEAQRGRLFLAEHERDADRGRLRQLERQLAEQAEHYELALLRARGERANPPATERAAQDRSDPGQSARTVGDAQQQLRGLSELRGERDGVRARERETELAYAAAQERADRADRQLAAAHDKQASLRAEIAELSAAVQARSAYIAEQGTELAREQQELRAVRAQLGAAVAAQRDERRARDADAEAWQTKLDELDAARERDSASWRSERASYQRAHEEWTLELKDFLAELRIPLSQLQAALDDPSGQSNAMRNAEAHTDDATAPGGLLDPAAVEKLEQALRASEVRCAELEAALAARSPAVRDGTISTLKGELIDTRADAARLSDDLQRERARRRRLVVTVRALQAALESGEAAGPWIDELIAALNEGASVPPFNG